MNLFNASEKKKVSKERKATCDLCIWQQNAYIDAHESCTSTALTFAERDERTTKYTHTERPQSNLYASVTVL